MLIWTDILNSMSSNNVLTKLVKMEAGLKALKRSILRKPDFEADGKKWSGVERSARAARKRTFQRFYGMSIRKMSHRLPSP